MNSATPVRQWWKTALASGALALLVLAVYHDIGSHEFIEFDDAFFVEAPHVREGLTLDGVKKSFTTQRGMWFPLTWLSHMADAHFYGDAPAGHHYTNLLLHAANAILLFLALCRLTGAMGPSLAAAALFAVHPLNTETVAYISCRKDLLSTFFWILAMGAYAGYARAPSAGRYLTVAGLMVLGMMAKPMLISLPVILLLLDYWPLRRFSRTAAAFLVKEKVPLLLVSLVFLGITVSVQRQTGAISSLAELSLSLRLENALVSYALYIGRMFRPVSLAVFYPFPRAISFWQWSGSAVLLALITVIAWRARGRTPWVFTGWLWFLVSLVPVIGLVKVGQHAMADRYAYIPMIGLLVALVWSLSGHAETRRTGRVLWGALAVLAVAVLGMASYRQAGFWKNSITLFEHALRVTGDSDLVHNNLGKAYFERGDADAARAHIIEALRINPYLPQANYNMGMLFLKKGDADRALPWFSRAVEVDPGFPDARYSLANVFFNKGDFENALNHYTRILKDPEESPADLLAETHNDMGVIYAQRKKGDMAESHFREALDLNPELAAAHNNLGLLLSSRGETDRAEAHFLTAIALDPGFLDAANNLVTLYRFRGKFAEAAALLEKLLLARPDSAVSIAYNIACLYALQNDRAEAVAWLEKAVNSGFDLWPLLEGDVDLENIRDTDYYKKLITGRGGG